MLKKKTINTQFLKRTIELLDKVLEEFDTSDADHDEGLLKRALTTLINEGYMTVREKGFGLRDLVEEVLGDHASDDLVNRSETFDILLDTYIGEPSDEDMEDAYLYLEKILSDLRKKSNSIDKRQDKQESLWTKS